MTQHAAKTINEVKAQALAEWMLDTLNKVDYDPSRKTYFLPREHAVFLTRAASPNNLAATAQFITVLASVENEIVEAFRNGGGVPYSSYPRFHEVMAQESNQTVVAGLIDAILPLVPGLVEDLREGIWGLSPTQSLACIA